jgi:TatD DNase family protein
VLVDTHCHLDFASFDGDRDEVVTRAEAAGVGLVVVPSIDLASARAGLALAERYSAVYLACGIHPNSAAPGPDDWLGELAQLISHPKVVAIGEVGLDYYRDHTPRSEQRAVFAAQLELAARLRLPVIIHNRDADADMLRLLGEAASVGRPEPGVMHSFSGGPGMAEAALALGYYLGFTGPITYKNAARLREVATLTPMERLLVETDAPFLPPQPWRGRRNEPAYVTAVAEQIAALRGLTIAEVAAQTTANAARLFGLPIA